MDTKKEIVKRIQEIDFKMLCDIDDFCKKNNIVYFLSGGSCLGAVRHKGFIPWDDDVDIMLPRRDYERFIKLAPRIFEGVYGVGSLQTDKKWRRPNARVYDLNTTLEYKDVNEVPMGVSIDVYPIDGVPDSILGRKLFFIHLKLLDVLKNSDVRKTYMPDESFVWLKKVLAVCLKPIGSRFFAKRMEKVASNYDYDTSAYVACSVPAHYGSREVIEKRLMSQPVMMPFEGRMLPVPSGYHTYLSNLYGDYMTIPKDAETKGYSHLDIWDVNLDKKQNRIS